MMSEQIFISYSREELTFVDSLYQDLIGAGYPIWLDFRELLVGENWQTSIDGALENSKIVLLVISSSALASDNVEREWKASIEQGKRVIILLFEAVILPPQLKAYVHEWIDFRQSYAQAMYQLTQLLQQPASPMTLPIPESGFAIPRGLIGLRNAILVLIGMMCMSAVSLITAWLAQPEFFSKDIIIGVGIVALILGWAWYSYQYAQKIIYRIYDFWDLLLIFWIALGIITVGVIGAWASMNASYQSPVLGTIGGILFIMQVMCFIASFYMPTRISSGDVYRWSSPRTGFSTGLQLKNMSQKGLIGVLIFFVIGFIAGFDSAIQFFLTVIYGLILGAPLLFFSWWLAGDSIRRYRKQSQKARLMVGAKAKKQSEPLRIAIISAKQDESIAYEIHQTIISTNHLIVAPPFAHYVIVVLSSAHRGKSLDITTLQKGALIIPIILENVEVPPSLKVLQWINWSNGVNMDALKILLKNPNEIQNRQYLPGEFPERPRHTQTTIPKPVQQIWQDAQGNMGRGMNNVMTTLAQRSYPMQTLNPQKTRSLAECLAVFGIDEAHLQHHRKGEPTPNEIALVRKEASQTLPMGIGMLVVAFVLLLIDSELIRSIGLGVGMLGIALVGIAVNMFQKMSTITMVKGGIHRTQKQTAQYQAFLVECNHKQYQVHPDVWHRLWDDDEGVYRVYLLANKVVSIEPDDILN